MTQTRPKYEIKDINLAEQGKNQIEWADKSKNLKHRDMLIVQYISLVKYAVGRLRNTLPNTIATDDIASFGVEGLINAIERFDATKGSRFETYALMRIRGTIIDRIRSQDWVPRSTRKKFKTIQTTIMHLQAKLGRAPSSEELSDELGIPKEKIEATLNEMDRNSVMSINDNKGGAGSDDKLEIIDTIQDKKAVDPLEKLEEQDVQKNLSNSLAKLPERERMLLALYYHENMTLKEIGEALKISESRVCQLHAQAIMKLRKLLNNEPIKMKKAK